MNALTCRELPPSEANVIKAVCDNLIVNVVVVFVVVSSL